MIFLIQIKLEILNLFIFRIYITGLNDGSIVTYIKLRLRITHASKVETIDSEIEELLIFIMILHFLK